MKRWLYLAIAVGIGLYAIHELTVGRCVSMARQWVWSEFRCDD